MTVVCWPAVRRVFRHALHALFRGYHRHAAVHSVVALVCVSAAGLSAAALAHLADASAGGFMTLEDVHQARVAGGALRVPEPSSLAMFAAGVALFAVFRSARRRWR